MIGVSGDWKKEIGGGQTDYFMYILQIYAVNGTLKIPTEFGTCETEHR
jgi:hypothetical protein